MKVTLKLVMAFMLGAIVLTGIHGYLAIQREQRVFAQEAKADAQRLADSLQQVIPEVWQQSGPDGLSELIRRAGGYAHELRVRWVWFDASPGHPDCPMAPPGALTAVMIQQHVTVPARGSDGADYLHTYWPVPVEAERKGGLEVSRSMTRLEESKRAVIIRTVTLMASILLLSGVVAVILGVRIVGRPLQQLLDKTRRIGAGDLSGPVQLCTFDELTELGESLNQMCEELSQSQARVREETIARIATMEQLRHADRLKTVGRLASGMAHELGTPLNVIAGRAGLIASGRLSASQVVESAQAIKTETDRMTTIIRQLLDFARRNAPQRADADLWRIVRETTRLLTALAEKQQVSFQLTPAPEPANAMVDAAQMQQVFTNLFVNAIQAMPNGGVVRVVIRAEEARQPEGLDASPGKPEFEVTEPLSRQEQASPNGSSPLATVYWRVDVEDEGEGIAPEYLDHLFEPFFTTKDVGAGTGLGLSIAYGIVQEHGGWIDVISQQGQGSRFSVYLPQQEA